MKNNCGKINMNKKCRKLSVLALFPVKTKKYELSLKVSCKEQYIMNLGVFGKHIGKK